MNPTTFKSSNGELSQNGTTIPIYHEDGHNVSCWRLSFKDRIRLLVSGKLWLTVVSGAIHPVVEISAKSPIKN